MTWSKGRGRLGIFKPLLGAWEARQDTEMGAMTCSRCFEPVLGGKYIQLQARWVSAKIDYQEIALFGVNKDKQVCFWSFTSDGKQSQGQLADVTDLHPQALGFEANMDMGLARQAYWPGDGDQVIWVVESSTKKGWNRFAEHLYYPV